VNGFGRAHRARRALREQLFLDDERLAGDRLDPDRPEPGDRIGRDADDLAAIRLLDGPDRIDRARIGAVQVGTELFGAEHRLGVQGLRRQLGGIRPLEDLLGFALLEPFGVLAGKLDQAIGRCLLFLEVRALAMDEVARHLGIDLGLELVSGAARARCRALRRMPHDLARRRRTAGRGSGRGGALGLVDRCTGRSVPRVRCESVVGDRS
jgi:hypothetical protein